MNCCYRSLVRRVVVVVDETLVDKISGEETFDIEQISRTYRPCSSRVTSKVEV